MGRNVRKHLKAIEVVSKILITKFKSMYSETCCTPGVNTEYECCFRWALFRMGVILDGCYFEWALFLAFTVLLFQVRPPTISILALINKEHWQVEHSNENRVKWPLEGHMILTSRTTPKGGPVKALKRKIFFELHLTIRIKFLTC